MQSENQVEAGAEEANAKGILGANSAHSGFGDFAVRDGLDRDTGSSPDVRSGLSGLPACVSVGREPLLRMPLHVAASVQRVGIGPRGTVRHQSIFRGPFRARGLSAASPGLLKSLGNETGHDPEGVAFKYVVLV